MSTQKTKLTSEDILTLKRVFERNKRWTKKIAGYAFLILIVPLFIPIEILQIFKRSARNLHNESSFLFFELGPFNVLLFLVTPTVLVVLAIYFYLLKVPMIKKDIKQQNKKIISIKIKELKRLEGKEKEDLWMYNYKIIYESNNYGYTEEFFNSAEKPHYVMANEFQIHLTEIANAELKREII